MIDGHASPLLIDWVSPINWRHPLNCGLVGWWMGVPGATGGPLMHDLTRRANGILTNMDPGTDWVGSQYGPVLDCDATDDYVVVGSPPTLTLGSEWTFTFSALPTYSSESAVYNTGSLTDGGAVLYVKNDRSLAITDQWTYFENTSASVLPVAGVWFCGGLAYGGGAGSFFSEGTVKSTFTRTLGSGSAEKRIGRSNVKGDNTRYFNGKIQFVAVHNRKLSDAEISIFNQQWQRGFPDLLNRPRTHVRGEAAAASGNRRRRVLICGRAA